ncbi:MAG: ABC transporter ATP-binding protein [Planctomycetes bacterium]|nr:ABC transporter ATP-binding protein [Planctomycetota bacterium]
MNPETLSVPALANAAAPDTILAARGITRSFQIGSEKLEVLHGVDLELRRGELLALVGQSGAGKSTLLHILGLLDPPTSGTVELDGESAWKLSVERRASLRNRKLGFVFQFYHLLPELNALENVLLPAMIAYSAMEYGGRKKELRARAEAALERFGLSTRLKHRPAQLSGGERQRVAIARALFLDPPILIADEPTGNLDSATGEKVLELLLEEQRKRSLSMLLVTHDERVARRCKRVVTMRDGRIESEAFPGAAAG